MGDCRLRIEVTGANGFVGRHLTRTLSEFGDVVAVVRPGARPPDFPDVRTVGDISIESQCYQALDGIDLEVEPTFAVYPGIQEVFSNPAREFREFGRQFREKGGAS